jgi:hypothetical protein
MRRRIRGGAVGADHLIGQDNRRGTLSDQLLWKYGVPLTLICTVETCV